MHHDNYFLIGLDRTAFDRNLISFIQKSSRIIPHEKLHFIHFSPDVGGKDTKPEKESISDEVAKIESELRATVEEGFPEQNNLKVEVTQGNPAKGLHKISRKIDPDFLILGRKEQSGESGVKPEKLVATSTCSTILVPAREYSDFKKLHVAIDFSEVSLMALTKAVELSKVNDAQLYVQHVVTIPPDFRRSGKSYEDYTRQLEKIAQKEAKEFLQEANLEGISIDYTLCRKGETAQCIAEYAGKKEVELLIVGSKGRTNAASVLLGSIAEKVANHINQIPVLVIKKKNENLNLIDAILS